MDVKDLGRRIEAKHIESYGQLMTLAKEKLITLPTVTSKRDQAEYDRLKKKTNLHFDKAYCNMTYAEHREAIALFEKAYEDATDPEIRAWAETTLPELKSQLGFAAMCQKVYDEQ